MLGAKQKHDVKGTGLSRVVLKFETGQAHGAQSDGGLNHAVGIIVGLAVVTPLTPTRA